MGMIEEIRNDNIKKVIKRIRNRKLANVESDLRDSLLVELLFANLIIPASDVTEEKFTFEFVRLNDEFDNFQVFTDLDEYNKVYGDNKSIEPVIFNLLQFENNIYSYLAFMVVNKSFKIEMDEIWYIIGFERSYELYAKEELPEYTLEKCQKLIEKHDNADLIEYLNARKYIQSYISLFDVLEKSVLFTDIQVEKDFDKSVLYNEVGASFNIHDKYIITYTNLKDVESEYYAIVDMIELMRFVIFNQLEGIIIDNGTKQTKLRKSQLLKNYRKILMHFSSSNLNGVFKYIFKK